MRWMCDVIRLASLVHRDVLETGYQYFGYTVNGTWIGGFMTNEMWVGLARSKYIGNGREGGGGGGVMDPLHVERRCASVKRIVRMLLLLSETEQP